MPLYTKEMTYVECNITRTRANAKATFARFVLVVVVRQTAGKLLASAVAVNDICSRTRLELLRGFSLTTIYDGKGLTTANGQVSATQMTTKWSPSPLPDFV